MAKVIIKTKGTEFEQNGKEYAIIDSANRAGKPVMISEEEVAIIKASTTEESGE